MSREFKYYPEDFGKLTVRVMHMDIHFDVYDEHTDVTSNLKAKALENISELQLNAKNLEVHEVTCDCCEADHEYKTKENILIIKFKEQIPKDKEFTITTKTTCRPTRNILEGLYYDETPEGAPPQQITQCQQWGFQRIVPCIDDMTAKCTYTTTITADARYTNLITNGDVVEQKRIINDRSTGEERAQIKYTNTITPMAPYLFFLGCGTYSTFKKEFEYPDGDKFMLELLVPPDGNKESAEKALQILYDGIMWIHLFTGPDKYKNEQLSREILELTRKRDRLLAGNQHNQASEVRQELKQLVKPLILGYKYTGTVYREIGMQNSDFGGMENVGNTTITTNRIMPFPDITDPSFEYMIRVKVHEYYHNLNGSEVTGRSPFEIWLNEAVTVHIEKEYHAFLFGEEYSRLQTVLTLHAPGTGTFAEDKGVASMPVEPDGFNDPNELITGVTYVKSPEFVRMIQTLIGKEKFVQALDNYHKKFAHGNATRQDWIKSMEGVSGESFQNMAQAWLKQTGYPKVYASSSYDNNSRTFTITLKQEGYKSMPWEFPFDIALIDKDGNIIVEEIHHVKNPDETIQFKNVDKPAIVSLNRGGSFYGKVICSQSDEELFLQAGKDPDIVNKYIAFYKLADKEKLKLIEDPDTEGTKPSEKFIDLFFGYLSDKDLMQRVGAQILMIFESVEKEKYSHSYQQLYDAKIRIIKAIAEKYKDKLIDIYIHYNNFKSNSEDHASQDDINAIKHRQIKNACLGILSKLDTPDIHEMIRKQLDNPCCATDKWAALGFYMNSSAEDKLAVLDQHEEKSKSSLVSWEAFLAVVAGIDSDDYLDIIKRVKGSDHYRIEQSNDQRALLVRFALNRRKSMLTPEGREFVKDCLIELSKLNEYTAGHILGIFGNIDLVPEEHHIGLVDVLVQTLNTLNQEKTPSVYNTILRILKGSQNATKKYQENYGEIKQIYE